MESARVSCGTRRRQLHDDWPPLHYTLRLRQPRLSAGLTGVSRSTGSSEPAPGPHPSYHRASELRCGGTIDRGNRVSRHPSREDPSTHRRYSIRPTASLLPASRHGRVGAPRPGRRVGVPGPRGRPLASAADGSSWTASERRPRRGGSFVPWRADADDEAIFFAALNVLRAQSAERCVLRLETKY